MKSGEGFVELPYSIGSQMVWGERESGFVDVPSPSTKCYICATSISLVEVLFRISRYSQDLLSVQRPIAGDSP